MSGTELISVIAAILCCISFAPDALRAIRSKDVAHINLVMYSMFVGGVTCWLIYGILTAQTSLVVSNGFTLTFASITLGCKIRYDVLPGLSDRSGCKCQAHAE